MIGSQEASTLEWDASPLEYSIIPANSEITRKNHTIFYRSHLPHIGPEQYSPPLRTHWFGFRARKRALNASGRESGLIYVLCSHSMFSVISWWTLSGKNRLSAWATWSAMHRAHLFFSSSDQTFHRISVGWESLPLGTPRSIPN